MATMIREVFEAFRAANVPDEKAMAAAEAIAGYDNRFAKIESGHRLHRRMLTVNTALLIANFVKQFI
jgi:hypothetical protein